MDIKIKQLVDLLQQYFGDMGIMFLKREMKKLDINSLDSVGQIKKVMLIHALSKNVFADIMSIRKLSVIKAQLVSIFNLTAKTFVDASVGIRGTSESMEEGFI